MSKAQVYRNRILGSESFSVGISLQKTPPGGTLADGTIVGEGYLGRVENDQEQKRGRWGVTDGAELKRGE